MHLIFFIFSLMGHAEPGYGPTLIAGVAAGPGSAKSDITIQSRTMIATDAHALLGWGLSGITLGVLGQYFLLEQTTSPSEVGNTNMSGQGYFLGLGAACNLGNFVLQGAYDFSGKQQLRKKTVDDEKVTYQEPKGFTAIVSYRFNPTFTIDLLYSNHTYSEQTTGQTTNKLTSDKLKESYVALGFGFVY